MFVIKPDAAETAAPCLSLCFRALTSIIGRETETVAHQQIHTDSEIDKAKLS